MGYKADPENRKTVASVMKGRMCADLHYKVTKETENIKLGVEMMKSPAAKRVYVCFEYRPEATPSTENNGGVPLYLKFV